jgi:hypothetical protein
VKCDKKFKFVDIRALINLSKESNRTLLNNVV